MKLRWSKEDAGGTQGGEAGVEDDLFGVWEGEEGIRIGFQRQTRERGERGLEEMEEVEKVRCEGGFQMGRGLGGKWQNGGGGNGWRRELGNITCKNQYFF